MEKSSVMALTLTTFVFISFLLNLVMSAFFNARFMSDVVEMLALLATSISFVVAILLIEKQKQHKEGLTDQ